MSKKNRDKRAAKAPGFQRREVNRRTVGDDTFGSLAAWLMDNEFDLTLSFVKAQAEHPEEVFKMLYVTPNEQDPEQTELRCVPDDVVIALVTSFGPNTLKGYQEADAKRKDEPWLLPVIASKRISDDEEHYVILLLDTRLASEHLKPPLPMRVRMFTNQADLGKDPQDRLAKSVIASMDKLHTVLTLGRKATKEESGTIIVHFDETSSDQSFATFLPDSAMQPVFKMLPPSVQNMYTLIKTMTSLFPWQVPIIGDLYTSEDKTYNMVTILDSLESAGERMA